jgi:hypothetical protein
MCHWQFERFGHCWSLLLGVLSRSKATSSDIETRLRKLQGLEKKGLITKEDAARKRKELLEKL